MQRPPRDWEILSYNDKTKDYIVRWTDKDSEKTVISCLKCDRRLEEGKTKNTRVRARASPLRYNWFKNCSRITYVVRQNSASFSGLQPSMLSYHYFPTWLCSDKVVLHPVQTNKNFTQVQDGTAIVFGNSGLILVVSNFVLCVCCCF